MSVITVNESGPWYYRIPGDNAWKRTEAYQFLRFCEERLGFEVMDEETWMNMKHPVMLERSESGFTN